MYFLRIISYRSRPERCYAGQFISVLTFAESWGHRSKSDTIQALKKRRSRNPDPDFLSSWEIRKPKPTRISYTLPALPKTNPAIKGRQNQEAMAVFSQSSSIQQCLNSQAKVSPPNVALLQFKCTGHACVLEHLPDTRKECVCASMYINAPK